MFTKTVNLFFRRNFASCFDYFNRKTSQLQMQVLPHLHNWLALLKPIYLLWARDQGMLGEHSHLMRWNEQYTEYQAQMFFIHRIIPIIPQQPSTNMQCISKPLRQNELGTTSHHYGKRGYSISLHAGLKPVRFMLDQSIMLATGLSKLFLVFDSRIIRRSSSKF